LKIIEYIFAVSPTNAFVERIFSAMKNLWTGERNQLSIGIIKAEIMTNFNYSWSCQEFYEFLETESGYQFIKAVKSEKKIQF
jgi:hypothetical protein